MTAPGLPVIVQFMEKELKETELRQTVRISISEGVLAQVFMTLSGAGSVFITKFAVFLGALPYQFGILFAIGQLFMIFQPIGVLITRKLTSRKEAVLKIGTYGRAMVLLFGLPAVFFPQEYALWVFLFLFFMSLSVQAMGVNAWTGWISDIIPLRFRGRFFSVRNQFLMAGGLLSGYILGALLDLFDPDPRGIARFLHSLMGENSYFSPDHAPVAFCLVFSIAAFVGLVGLLVLRRQPERAKEPEQEEVQEIFLSPFRDGNFRRLLVYGFWWMFATGIGGPFWQPFMIEKLRISIVGIQVYGTLSAISSIATLPLWGRMIDRFGNKSAMRFAILLGGLNPILWLFATPDFYWVIYLEAVLAGIMWAGGGVIATNFVLSIAPEEKRQVYSGVFAAFSGVGMMITMLLSGFLLPPPLKVLGLSLEREQVLFGLTGLARWTALIPLTWIREPLSKPMGEVISYYRQFAKVRLLQLVARFSRKGM